MIRMKRNEMMQQCAQTQCPAADQRRSSRPKLSATVVAVMTTAALVLSPFAVTGQALAAPAAAAKPQAALAPFVNPKFQNYKQVEYAIKHNLVQPLNTVVTKDGYKLTMNGFIADKYELIILFTAQADSNRAFTSQGSIAHELQLTDVITGKVISGKKMNDAGVYGVSPAKQNNIMYGTAVIRLTTPLTTAPQKVAAEFQLTSLTTSELKQVDALEAQMMAEAKKAYQANPEDKASKTSPELLKKYNALKAKVKKSPPLKAVFAIDPKVWEQESLTLTPEETVDMAGHPIKVNMELTPFTTITTLTSDEAVFTDKAFKEKFNNNYYPSLLIMSGNGEYKPQEGSTYYTYSDHKLTIISESYFLLDKPQSLRLDFTNMKDRKITQQLIIDLSKQ
ncbi:DUF4179 domain-containing protein [Paenibacillus sp. FSL R7-0337]|uniref:DUF4179 domain-containing protein n=1 Tax=Paenibacillus sp. FSL R7-0337 TaxID=1926588 RepID=UPI00096E2FEA|nr:DUF4179 domain-containing protein [Paenibacillus sp. FSL R7-0337]OMF96815.1 hypothetical protein BK147_11630 [Paenibacillus sp. FSL R7-0337]